MYPPPGFSNCYNYHNAKVNEDISRIYEFCEGLKVYKNQQNSPKEFLL